MSVCLFMEEKAAGCAELAEQGLHKIHHFHRLSFVFQTSSVLFVSAISFASITEAHSPPHAVQFIHSCLCVLVLFNGSE